MKEDRNELVRPVDGEPEKMTWNQRDAQIMHGVDLLWRALLGLVAGLLGVLFVFAALDSTAEVVHRNGLAKTVAMGFLIAWVAATLLAFAVGQALQLFYVGGDQAYDQRLWSRMTPQERGRWTESENSAAIMTFRLFVLLVGTLTLFVDVAITRNAWRGDGVWGAILATLVANLAAAGLLLWHFRLLPRLRMPPRRAPIAWVSEGRWRVEVVDDTRGLAFLYLLAGGIGTAYCGWPVLIGEARDDDLAALAFWGVASLVTLLGAVWVLARPPARREPIRWLEITRPTDTPLALECRACFPIKGPGQPATEWIARLAAYYSYSHALRDRYSTSWARWFDAPTPARFDPGTGEWRFSFRLQIPGDPPADRLTWKVQIERPGEPNPVCTFDLPERVVYPEETAVA